MYLGQKGFLSILGMQMLAETSRRCFGKAWRIRVRKERAPCGTRSRLSTMAQCAVQVNSDVSLIYLQLLNRKMTGRNERSFLCSEKDAYCRQHQRAQFPRFLFHPGFLPEAHGSVSCHKDSSPFYFGKQSTVVGFDLIFVLLWCFPPIFLLCSCWRLLFCRTAGCLNILALVVACVYCD